MRLSEKAIAALALEEGRKDRLVADDAVPGLFVRVTPGGKSFVAQYVQAGVKRRVPIGKHGAVTLDAARTAARGYLGAVARGCDPAAERAEARAKAAAEREAERLTLAALLDRWAALGLEGRKEGYRKEATRALRVAFARHLGKPADALTRKAVVEAVDGLAERGKATTARRVRAYGSACFNWGLKREAVRANPFAGLPDQGGDNSRDRVLTDREIGLVWCAAGRMGWPFGAVVRLLLLTGQRRDEVAGMAWSEVSSDGATWTIPARRAKNGRAHVVHLSEEARAVLAAVPRWEGVDLVFTTTGGRTAPSGFSKAVERLRGLVREERGEALPGWTLHDFRRTMVSWLAGTGTPPHVADKLLNHVSGTISGVAAVYQRNQFLPERKVALERWAAHVVACGEGRVRAPNVVPLRPEVA